MRPQRGLADSAIASRTGLAHGKQELISHPASLVSTPDNELK